MERLARLPALTELDLSWNKLGAAGGAAVAEHLLKGNSTLTTLDLCWDDLSTAGGAAIVAALARNVTLTSLKTSPPLVGVEPLLARNRERLRRRRQVVCWRPRARAAACLRFRAGR